MSKASDKDIDDTTAPLMEHLIELRGRLINCLLAFVVMMIMMVVMVIVVVIMVVMMMIVRLALFPGSPRHPQGDRNDQHPGDQLEPGFGRVCIPAPTKP